MIYDTPQLTRPVGACACLERFRTDYGYWTPYRLCEAHRRAAVERVATRRWAVRWTAAATQAAARWLHLQLVAGLPVLKDPA